MKDVLMQLKIVFNNKRRYVFVFVMALAVFLLIRSLPNMTFLNIFASQYGVLSGKFLSLFGKYIAGTFGSTSILDSFVLILLSLLTALNIVIFKAFFHHQKNLLSSRGGGLSLVGIFFGLFGAGCASCGTLLLAPILSALGIAGGLSKLPLHGFEFSLIGIALLLISNWIMLKRMTRPIVCDID